MNKVLLLVFVNLLLVAQSAFSQFTINGQFRTRGEFRNGYRALATDQNYATPLVSQRSRLIFNFAESDFEFRFSAQDARVWGQNWNGMANNAVQIYEAWSMYKFNQKSSIKIGRQELWYDDQKLIAVRNYSITGATYDAALFAYSNSEKGSTFHWGSMVNNIQETNFLQYYNFPLSFKYLSFLWYEKLISDNLTLNAINIFDLTQNPNRPNIMFGRNTLGSNVIFKFGDSFGGRVGGYYQFGEAWVNLGNIHGQRNAKVSAYSYNASLWINPSESIRISVNYDTYSGNDWSQNSRTFTGFNRIMAAGHAHLGFIDYFTSMDLAEVNRAGINDLFITVDYKVNSKLTLQPKFHYFTLNKPYFPTVEPEGFVKVNPDLGTELDIIANYRVNRIFSMEFAFMTIFPSKTLEAIKMNGGEVKFSHFAYVSLLFTPRFFEWQKPTPVQE
jgi:hypothetical protein